MSTLVLNGAATGESAVIEQGKTVAQILAANGEEVREFHLRDMNLLPCRSCGSCGITTPGECVLRDELAEILRVAARSRVMVLLTAVRFGGYSSQLKKVIDRLMTMGLPLYVVRGGSLLHPTRYENPRALLGIGVGYDLAARETEAFAELIHRNAVNMLVDRHAAVIVDAVTVGAAGTGALAEARPEDVDAAARLEAAIMEVLAK